MITIGFVTAGPLSEEQHAAWEFLATCKGIHALRLQAGTRGFGQSLRKCGAVWYHEDQQEPAARAFLSSSLSSALYEFLNNGGGALFSLLAATLPTLLGIEPVPPNCILHGPLTGMPSSRGRPDPRGHATFLGHPLFDALHGGVFTWLNSQGNNHVAAVYEDSLPVHGRIVAIERQQNCLNPSRRTIVEHTCGKGRVVSVGTHFFFSGTPSEFRPYLAKLASNCFDFLTSNRQATTKASYWFDHSSEQPVPPAQPAARAAAGRWSDLGSAGPIIRRAHCGHQFFDVTGQRIAITGYEDHGVEDIWIYPFRAAHQVDVAARVGTQAWKKLRESACTVIVRPESIEREWMIGGCLLRETVVAHPDRPGGLFRWETTGGSDIDLAFSAAMDLTLPWPVPQEAAGPVRSQWLSPEGPLLLTLAGSSMSAAIGFSQAPLGPVPTNRESSAQPTPGLHFSLPAGGSSLVVGIAGSNISVTETLETLARILGDPALCLRQAETSVAQLHDRSVLLLTPDRTINEGFEWALTALDRFTASTPGVGTSYMAGYPVAHGDRENRQASRAWYSGRSALWTAFAALQAGQFERVANVLSLFGRYQDLSGKIMSELSPSGHALYEAADSTPLYVVLMARYLKVSGDIRFAEQEYHHIQKAMAFCFTTDTDGDHLIENTQVGHGWVEAGALFPAHAETYLEACWGAALAEGSVLAKALNRPEHQRWEREAGRVRRIINRDLWNSDTEHFAFGKQPDGTVNEQLSVFPVVAVEFALTEPDKAECFLEELVSSYCTADWGVGSVSANAPFYDPGALYEGSVWPLFTGWTSLAEFSHGRPVQGFVHMAMNLLLHRPFAAGLIPGVLRGDRFAPVAEGFQHQAWSESMVVQPLLEGMLGLSVDAKKGAVHIRPYLPPQWDHIDIRRIRVGDALLNVVVEREPRGTTYRLSSTGRPTLDVTITPVLFPGSRLSAICRGQKREPASALILRYADMPPLSIQMRSDALVRIEHSPGIGIVPPVPQPVPGAPSVGFRLLREICRPGLYSLIVEGKPGTRHELRLHDRGGMITRIRNADIVDRSFGVITIAVRMDYPRTKSETIRRKEITIEWNEP